MLLDKWQFDTSQDWEVPGDNLDNVSLEIILDPTLQALSFYYFLLGYLEEGVLWFIDVIDKLELAIELEDNGQPINDSENEKVRKRLECAAKKSVWRNNLGFPVQQAFVAGFKALLMSGPALSSCPCMSALLSCLRLPTLLLSCPPIPTLLSCLELPTLLLFCSLMPALLSPHLPVLSSLFMLALASRFMLAPAPTWLTSSAFKTFKQTLSDEFLGHQSTSSNPLKPLCLFLILGPLPKQNNCKQLFNLAFINSCLLPANHAVEEIDPSFKEYGYPPHGKFNRLWQLELPDCKPIYIMETMSPMAILFCNPLSAPCPCHTMKLASNLELKRQSIASRQVKERIELLWPNKTIYQLDQLFQNNPEWWMGTTLINT